MGDFLEKTQRRDRQINVLVTGFGAFRHTTKNPSWEAVKLLSKLGVRPRDPTKSVSIDISYIPVEYQYIIDVLPYYHSNCDERPSIPNDVQQDPKLVARDEYQPNKRYDLVLHVGQGRAGGIRLESLGHQLGYRLFDAAHELPPVVNGTEEASDDAARAPEQYMSPAEKGAGMNRGYPLPYDMNINLLEEGVLETDLDVSQLVDTLSSEFPDFKISNSTHAGRYLCEFILFGSLAESRLAQIRAEQSGQSWKAPTVLFVHVPPENDPLALGDMARVLQTLVGEIAGNLQGGRREI